MFDLILHAFGYGAMVGAAIGGFGLVIALCAVLALELVVWVMGR